MINDFGFRYHQAFITAFKYKALFANLKIPICKKRQVKPNYS